MSQSDGDPPQNKKGVIKITDLFESAMKLFHQGDYQRATMKFRQLIDYDKTDARAWNGLGMCKVRLHDFHEARASFLNAIRFNPDNQIYLKNLHEMTKNVRKTLNIGQNYWSL